MLFSKKLYRPHLRPFSWMLQIFAKYQLRKMPKVTARNFDARQRQGGIPTLLSVHGDHQCNGCGLCPEICPSHCLELKMQGSKVAALNLEWSRCIQCGLCWEICPTSALAPAGELMHHALDGRPLKTQVNLVTLVKKSS